MMGFDSEGDWSPWGKCCPAGQRDWHSLAMSILLPSHLCCTTALCWETKPMFSSTLLGRFLPAKSDGLAGGEWLT